MSSLVGGRVVLVYSVMYLQDYMSMQYVYVRSRLLSHAVA
jgi:hypothetical protein